MNSEKQCDRKQFYAAISILLHTAFNALPEYDFRTLANSIREYLRKLEEECE